MKTRALTLSFRTSKALSVGILAIVFALFALSDSVSASETTTSDECKWKGTVEFDPAVIGLTKNAPTNFGIGITASRQIYDYLSIGGKISLYQGWKFNAAPSLNIMARLHVEDFSKDITPYFDFDFGYRQSFEDTNILGFAFNPTIGLRYKQIGFGIGYDGFVHKGSLNNSLNIRLAYHFGYNSKKASEFFSKTDFALALGLIASGGCKKDDGPNKYKATAGAGLELSWLYNFNKYFSMGIMADMNMISVNEKTRDYDDNESVSAVIYGLRAKYKVKQLTFLHKIYPFVKVDLGQAINLDDYTYDAKSESSFYYSPGVGLALPFKDDSKSLDLCVSYAPISMSAFKGNYDSKSDEVGSVRITLGYTF